MKSARTTWILVFLLIGTFAIWNVRGRQIRNMTGVPKADLGIIPMQLHGWMGRDSALPEGVLSSLGLNEYIMRVYERNGRSGIWLYVGYYRSQAQGETVHSPRHCYPGSGWDPIEIEEEDVPIPSIGKTVRIRRFIVGKGDEREVVYYWYHERGRVIANEYESKAYQVVDSFVQGRNDGALVRFSMRAGRDTKPVTPTMIMFIQEMFPHIMRSMPG